jgi:hypothetical protein
MAHILQTRAIFTDGGDPLFWWFLKVFISFLVLYPSGVVLDVITLYESWVSLFFVSYGECYISCQDSIFGSMADHNIGLFHIATPKVNVKNYIL